MPKKTEILVKITFVMDDYSFINFVLKIITCMMDNYKNNYKNDHLYDG